MSFANIYTHRKVADTAAKGCDVCYRSTTSVLVAPENKDFFFVCPSHLKDRNFCAPIIDTAAVEAKKKKEMDEELERVKKEYEERQRKKKEKQDKEKSEEKDEDKDKSSQTEDKKSTDKKDDVEDKACATLQRKRSKQLTCCRASPTPQLKCQKRSPGFSLYRRTSLPCASRRNGRSNSQNGTESASLNQTSSLPCPRELLIAVEINLPLDVLSTCDQVELGSAKRARSITPRLPGAADLQNNTRTCCAPPVDRGIIHDMNGFSECAGRTIQLACVRGEKMQADTSPTRQTWGPMNLEKANRAIPFPMPSRF
ncbi:hypothetical protein BN1708_010486 [Verticillium longisporum]|uniref:Uncharacterized protein n=1 Tax=Verticillium longisporum TaxID=100787 RepID=A0A0G4KRQ7_VERLO|nr:hypothetical protein BN1708_010486 [Verticillium longisporum]